MSLSSKLRILREVMLGLWFLKTKKISHLDIKPDNILITKGLQCKISDFGEAHHSTISDYKVTGRVWLIQVIPFPMLLQNSSISILPLSFPHRWTSSALA